MGKKLLCTCVYELTLVGVRQYVTRFVVMVRLYLALSCVCSSAHRSGICFSTTVAGSIPDHPNSLKLAWELEIEVSIML